MVSKFFQEALLEPQEEGQALVEELISLQEQGRYDSGKKLASGGMKNILIKQDKMTERPVAMAEPRTDKQDHESLFAFIKEARLTAQVAHPNIVPVHEIGVNDEGLPYYTMKYIQGDNLGKVISKLKSKDPEFIEKYTLSRLLTIFIKVCEAVAFAHSKNIVHLDLKPDNILVGAYGQVQVCDWGLAQSLDDISENLEGQVFGTPGYLSPEQISGQGVGKSSDIFALGAILYNILTYEVPFKGGSLNIVLEKTLKGIVVPMKIVSPQNELPEVLELICGKCLSLRPDERYQGINELLEDIEAFQDNLPTRAQNPGVLVRLFLLLKRHKTISILSMTALLVIVCVSFYFSLKVQEESYKRKEVSEKAIEHYNDLAFKHLESFNFDKAKKAAETSLGYKSSTRAHVIMARIYLSRRELEQAEKHVYEIRLQDQRLLDLIQDLKVHKDRSSDEFFLLMVETLIREHYPGFVVDACAVRNANVIDLKEHLPFLKRMIERLNPEIESYELKIVDERIYFKSSAGFTRLSPFANLPVHQLILNGSNVRDLWALANKKQIDRLELRDTMVNDLKPLKGVKINYLDISNTLINDVKPILDLELSQLVVEGIKVRSLGHLTDYVPLKFLRVEEERYKAAHSKRVIKEMKQKGIIK